jgi:DNA ligase (NAD+)
MTKIIVSAGFDTLAKMEAAQVHEIAAIPGVGPTKAANFIQGIHEKRDLIYKLLSVGVQIKASSDGPLKGKTICMTGFRDAAMEAAIEEAGGSVKGSVSKQLDYLVAADPTSTSGKAQKARDYGTKVISQEQMWSMLE